MNTVTAQSVAETTLAQLGGRRFLLMTGAKNCMSHADGALSFRLPRGAQCEDLPANYVKISLIGDLYQMEVGYVRGVNYTVRITREMIYGDQLRAVFTDSTGLYTSL